MSRYSFPFFPLLTQRERKIELLLLSEISRDIRIARCARKTCLSRCNCNFMQMEGGYACLTRGTILQILPTYHFIPFAFYLDSRLLQTRSKASEQCSKLSQEDSLLFFFLYNKALFLLWPIASRIEIMCKHIGILIPINLVLQFYYDSVCHTTVA